MTKIEEIIEKNRLETNHWADQEFSDFGNVSVESAMKEYAEWYAIKYVESRQLQTGHIENFQGERPDIIVNETYFKYIYTLPNHD